MEEAHGDRPELADVMAVIATILALLMVASVLAILIEIVLAVIGTKWWEAFWVDYKEAYAYVRDASGWERGRREAVAAKWGPRPSMYIMHDSVLMIHPALVGKLKRLASERHLALAGGLRLYVSELVVENAPDEGWPDITVPSKPRLAP